MGFIEFNQRGNYNMSKELIPNQKQIVSGISKAFNKMESSKKGYVYSVIELGEKLNLAKEIVPFGHWEKWLKGNSEFVFDSRQAQKFMQIATNKTLVLEYFNDENSINSLTKAISDATPEQWEKVEQLKKEEELAKLAVVELPKAKKDDVIDGVFVEVKKPAPVLQIEEEFTEVEELQGLLHEQHSVAKALQEDNDSLVKIFESSDQITQALKELHIAKEINRGLEGRINGFMVETRELKKAVTYWKSRCKKLGDTNV
jgi:hypothetical protein